LKKKSEERDIKDKKAIISYFFFLSICMSGDLSGDRKSEQGREKEKERARMISKGCMLIKQGRKNEKKGSCKLLF
jgi:hypothetical protein